MLWTAHSKHSNSKQLQHSKLLQLTLYQMSKTAPASHFNSNLLLCSNQPSKQQQHSLLLHLVM